MKITRKQEIIDAIEKRMQMITIDKGYCCDAGKYVYDWIGRPVDEYDSPCLIIKDPIHKIDNESSYSSKNTLEIKIIVVLRDANNTTKKLRELCQDVVTAFSLNFETLPELENDREVTEVLLNVDEEGGMIGEALITFFVRYPSEKFCL